jgi:hypothetical protein
VEAEKGEQDFADAGRSPRPGGQNRHAGAAIRAETAPIEVSGRGSWPIDRPRTSRFFAPLMVGMALPLQTLAPCLSVPRAAAVSDFCSRRRNCTKRAVTSSGSRWDGSGFIDHTANPVQPCADATRFVTIDPAFNDFA